MLGNDGLGCFYILSIELTFLYLLATLCLVDHVESVIHILLDGIDETRVFLELTLPVLNVLHTFLRELGRKSELLHLGSSGYLTDKQLSLLGILTGCLATTVVHALTVQTLSVSCSGYNLFHQSIYIIVVMFIVLSLGYIGGILLCIIMSNACRIETDGHEVITGLQDEVIDRYLR